MALLMIETAGPDKRARRLHIQDDLGPVTTSAAVVRLLGLETGQDVSRDELQRRIRQIEPEQAKERAYRLLGYRDRSEAELRRRLGQDGYSESVVCATIDRLSELDFINDERFAYEWASSRARSGRGRTVILRELEAKGISAEMRRDVISQVFDEYSELDRARAFIRGADTSDSRKRQRVLGRLVRRGFPFEVALKAIELTSSEEQS